MQHTALGNGRYFLRLDPGDELVASLRAFAAELGLSSGFIQGLGSTQRLVLGFLDPETGEYVKRTFNEPMEVGSLSGTISFDVAEERVFVHLHGVFAPRELLAYTGHVHEAVTGLVMEVYVVGFDTRLERWQVPGKPFPWLLLPQEPRPSEDDEE